MLSVMRKIFPYIPIRGSQVKAMSEPSALCIPYSLETSVFQCQQVDPVTLELYVPYRYLSMAKSKADGSNWNVTSVSEYCILISLYLQPWAASEPL